MESKVILIPVARDLGASRSGASLAPWVLRVGGLDRVIGELGYQLSICHALSDPTVRPYCGDQQLYLAQEWHILAQYVLAALGTGSFPLIVGGDHSFAVGGVTGSSLYLRNQNKKLGLIWFDAHGDMNTQQTSPSGNLHGMALAHLIGLGDPLFSRLEGFSGKVDPAHTVLLGIRELDPGEDEAIRKSGIHLYTMRDIDERGMASVASEAIAIVSEGTGGFHLSFDIDGCDPHEISGVGTAVRGGISLREARLFMEMCSAEKGLVACDFVEFNPLLDRESQSVEASLILLKSLFGKKLSGV